MMTQATLLNLLRCPRSKAPVVADGDWIVSTDPHTRLRYQIRESIPVMLVDEAEELSPEAWGEVMHRHGRDPHTGAPLP